MNSHEFMRQPNSVVNVIFDGLYAYLKEYPGINVTQRKRIGDPGSYETKWLLLDKDNYPRFYVEYNADKNEMNCRRINILEIDYKIPPSKEGSTPNEYLRTHLEEFLDKGWYSLIEDIDKKQADTLKRLREQLNGKHQPFPFHEVSDALKKEYDSLKEMYDAGAKPRFKPQPTLKSMINSSMDEIMSEIASMKQKAQPTMNKMERVYKAMMNEMSKDD